MSLKSKVARRTLRHNNERNKRPCIVGQQCSEPRHRHVTNRQRNVLAVKFSLTTRQLDSGGVLWGANVTSHDVL